MIDKYRVLAVIPARGGSKGIPRKNIALVAGRPLINYSIECAKSSKYVDTLVVSTDDVEIADIAQQSGAEVPFLRPAELAGDRAKTVDAVEHAIVFLEKHGRSFDIVVLLQPTQPFRSVEDLDNSLESFVRLGGDGGLTTVSLVEDHPILIRQMNRDSCELEPLLKKCSTVRRQDMPNYYRVNGAVYVNWREDYKKGKSLNDNRFGYEMPIERSLDIDTVADLQYARWKVSSTKVGQLCDALN